MSFATCHRLCAGPSRSETEQLPLLQVGPRERGKARLQRRSRENNGPHSEHQPRRHLERRPPNRQGLCQAAACPGTGSSTRTAEQGHAVCHTPMPASSLQARWEREAPGKKRGSPSQTRAPAPRISPPRRSDSVPAAAWRLPCTCPIMKSTGFGVSKP